MRFLYRCFIVCLLPLSGWAQTLQSISGMVQAIDGRPLAGAAVILKGTYTGGSTDQQGHFELKANFAKGPVVMSVLFPNYETLDVPLNGATTALTVTLKPSLVLNQVVVAASRVEENIGRVPVTIEKATQRQVEQLTTPDVVAGLSRLKSVDISSSSMMITAFSTRGFNSSRAERVLQLSDYMDTQLPSTSSNFGNILGMPILDVESIEILHGPASALYGANAFNGVLLLNSRDPFLSPGLTVRLRGGNRNYLDGQLRYVHKIGDKLALKISGGYLTATEFMADNQDPTSSVIESNNNAAGSPLNYDAVNRYGDASAYTFPTDSKTAGYAGADLAGKTLFLPGYTERELLANDTKSYSLKIAPSLSCLISSSVKLTLDYKLSQNNTIYQNSSRFRFINSGTHQGRVEVKGDNWFARVYSTRDFSGGSDPSTDGGYNLGLLGAQLVNQLAPGFLVPGTTRPGTYAERYVVNYRMALGQQLAAGQSAEQAMAAAQAFATQNAPLLQPGTDAFNGARNDLIHKASFSETGVAQGSRLVLRSFLNDASAQYTFKNSFADLTAGGAYRQFLLGSNRTLFDETDNGNRLRNYEFGGYVQAAKNVLDEHLRLSGAVRVDNFKNFGTVASPRGSLVYTLGDNKEHNLRASFSRAYRSPAQTDQYQRLDVSRAIVLGNIGNGFQGYSRAILSALPADRNNPNLQVNFDKLRLEEVNTLEGGYRTQLTKNLYADFNYYFSTFNDFIGTQTLIGNIDGTRPALTQLATLNAPGSSVRVIQILANVPQRLQAQGASLALSYALNKELALTGNYSYNAFVTKNLAEGFQTFYNTPTHKFNLGLDGQALERKLSYNLNYRWVDAFRYESTFATGAVPVAQTVDAQVGYILKDLHTTLQAGGTNLFDSPNLQVYGAPNIGRIGYVGLLFNLE